MEFVSMDLNVVHIRCAVMQLSTAISNRNLTGDDDELPHAAMINIFSHKLTANCQFRVIYFA